MEMLKVMPMMMTRIQQILSSPLLFYTDVTKDLALHSKYGVETKITT